MKWSATVLQSAISSLLSRKLPAVIAERTFTRFFVIGLAIYIWYSMEWVASIARGVYRPPAEAISWIYSRSNHSFCDGERFGICRSNATNSAAHSLARERRTSELGRGSSAARPQRAHVALGEAVTHNARLDSDTSNYRIRCNRPTVRDKFRMTTRHSRNPTLAIETS